MKPKQKSKTHQEIEPSKTQQDFSFTITKIAVSQICQSVGFKGIQFSALETLTLITTKFLQSLAKSAVSSSNASNRTQSNLLDLINAFHDLSSVEGFPGASTLDKNNICLLESSVLKGIFSFVDSTDEIPFAKPIPRRGLDSCNNLFFSRKDLLSSHLHIPEWLPEFPDERTYKKCDEEVVRSDGEKLWEESDSVVNKSGESVGDFEQNKGIGNGDLAVERGRVKFKIRGVDKGGVKVRNGMCRGGKRVCWNGSNKSDGVGENQERKSGFKRRR